MSRLFKFAVFGLAKTAVCFNQSVVVDPVIASVEQRLSQTLSASHASLLVISETTKVVEPLSEKENSGGVNDSSEQAQPEYQSSYVSESFIWILIMCCCMPVCAYFFVTALRARREMQT